MTAPKRKLHHFQTKLKSFRTFYILVLLIISIIISGFALRQNNLNAIKLRDAVIQADKDNKDVEPAMAKLREYMYSHMNTDLTSSTSIKQPIQLKYSYDRAVQAEKDRASKTNERVYADAQRICEQRFPVGLSGSNRIPCIEEYVAENGTDERQIDDGVYKYNFVSPWWSPDLAGFAILVSLVLLVVLISKIILNYWLNSNLKNHL